MSSGYIGGWREMRLVCCCRLQGRKKLTGTPSKGQFIDGICGQNVGVRRPLATLRKRSGQRRRKAGDNPACLLGRSVNSGNSGDEFLILWRGCLTTQRSWATPWDKALADVRLDRFSEVGSPLGRMPKSSGSWRRIRHPPSRSGCHQHPRV